MRKLLREKVKTPERAADDLRRSLKKHGLVPVETVEVENPITHEKTTLTIRRDGTQESDLAITLADPSATRERKDYALSMYLWGRGAESASMMVDLMRYKGAHTKETRVFKSQVRFDFEMLVDSLVQHLTEQAERTAKMLGVDMKDWIKDYKKWLELPNNKGKDLTVWDYLSNRRNWEDTKENRLLAVSISQAMFDLSEAEFLAETRDNITRARNREKGGGIYVDGSGKVYSVNDPDVDAVIEADRAATREITQE